MKNISLYGKIVKIIANTANHRFKIGEMVEIISDNDIFNIKSTYVAKSLKTNNQYSINKKDFLYKFGKEQIQEQIDKLNKEKLELDTGIKFWVDLLIYLKEIGSDTYEETEYKAYQILKTINSKTTDKEKAKIVAQIVNRLNR